MNYVLYTIIINIPINFYFEKISSACGVSSVFVSGDAYANPAAVMFLSLKIVVLPVADGRRPGRRTAAFQPG